MSGETTIYAVLNKRATMSGSDKRISNYFKYTFSPKKIMRSSYVYSRFDFATLSPFLRFLCHFTLSAHLRSNRTGKLMQEFDFSFSFSINFFPSSFPLLLRYVSVAKLPSHLNGPPLAGERSETRYGRQLETIARKRLSRRAQNGSASISSSGVPHRQKRWNRDT